MPMHLFLYCSSAVVLGGQLSFSLLQIVAGTAMVIGGVILTTRF